MPPSREEGRGKSCVRLAALQPIMRGLPTDAISLGSICSPVSTLNSGCMSRTETKQTSNRPMSNRAVGKKPLVVHLSKPVRPTQRKWGGADKKHGNPTPGDLSLQICKVGLNAKHTHNCRLLPRRCLPASARSMTVRKRWKHRTIKRDVTSTADIEGVPTSRLQIKLRTWGGAGTMSTFSKFPPGAIFYISSLLHPPKAHKVSILGVWGVSRHGRMERILVSKRVKIYTSNRANNPNSQDEWKRKGSGR